MAQAGDSSFWNVTIPQLKSVSVAVTMLGIIWTFNLFVVIFLTTGGGPAGKTDILVTESYNLFQPASSRWPRPTR